MKGKHLVFLLILISGTSILVFRSSVQTIHYSVEGDHSISPRTDRAAPVAVPTTTDQQMEEATEKPTDLNVNPVLSDLVAIEPHSNLSQEVNTQLQYDKSSCQGKVTVVINDCEQKKRTLSKNETNSRLFAQLGPDLIKLRLVGNEVHSSYGKYMGECRYDFSFKLGIQGNYNLAITRLYADYNAQDELSNQWPKLLNEPLIVGPTELPKTNYHSQQVIQPSGFNIECTETHPPKGGKKPCTGLESTSGRWQRGAGRLFTRVRVKKIQKHPIIFQWALESEREARWEPDQCSVSRNVAVDKVPKKIVIGGDSQARALYFGLVNVLSGFGEECVRNITTIENEPPHCIANVKGSQRKQIQGIQIDFVDDLFLGKLEGAAARYASYDVIVAGFAQHPASKEHWSLDKYRRSLESKHRSFKALRAQGKKVIWYLAPQYPYTKSGYPVVVKDWRTDMRLKLFNGEAERLMRSSKIPVLDGFAVSMGMSHSSPDQAHYSNFVSYELVSLLLTMLS